MIKAFYNLGLVKPTNTQGLCSQALRQDILMSDLKDIKTRTGRIEPSKFSVIYTASSSNKANGVKLPISHILPSL
jgi:hypothetical protein